MSHFALVNKDNIVVTVIVCDEDPELHEHTRQMSKDVSGRWLQTSYNTRGNVHYDSDGKPSGREALRKNYAGIGYTYSDELDAFIAPKPFSNWILNMTTFSWEPPIPYPTENADKLVYIWHEEGEFWVPFDRTDRTF